VRNGGRNPAISRGDFSRDLGKLATSRETSAVIGQDKQQALERHFDLNWSVFIPKISAVFGDFAGSKLISKGTKVILDVFYVQHLLCEHFIFPLCCR